MSTKVRVNLANPLELLELPGVGPREAEAILKFRAEHGPITGSTGTARRGRYDARGPRFRSEPKPPRPKLRAPSRRLEFPAPACRGPVGRTGEASGKAWRTTALSMASRRSWRAVHSKP